MSDPSTTPPMNGDTTPSRNYRSFTLTDLPDESWTVHEQGRRVVDANGLTICSVPAWIHDEDARALAEVLAQLPGLLTYLRDGMGGPAGTTGNSHWARGDILDYVDGMTSGADYLGGKLGLDDDLDDPDETRHEP